MSDPQSLRSTNTQALGDILADYLQAVERGEAPDRQALLAAHPQLATELAAYFADLDRMNKLAAPLHMSDPTATTGLEAAAALPVVRYVGDYELEGEIARGGMGVVFKARQVSLNRVVALKMILAGQLASTADVQRFRTEAEAAANLEHANILPIYEVGEHDGHQYFSMKLVDGGNLAGRVAELVTKPREAAQLVATLARAVHFAHQRGILHRDLKPANILIDRDGTPIVTDFGLAKKTAGDSGLTHTGAIVGTPSYMAPEQARGEKQLTTAVDVYSLGAILYELLAGRPPFREKSVYETIQSVMEAEPTDPRSVHKKADRDLAAIALKCLMKDPARRYGTAAELADDLERWLAGEATHARPPSVAGLAWRWLRRNAATAATVVATGLTWGLLCGVALIAFDATKQIKMKYLAAGEDLFNPIGWAARLGEATWTRFSVIGGAIGLCLTIGWFIWAGCRPRTPAAALTVAGATGLLAALLANLFFSPVLGTEMPLGLYPLRCSEPPVMRFLNDGSLVLVEPELGGPHPDLNYLRRFVPEEARDRRDGHSLQLYVNAYNHLAEVNRIHAASIGIWISQFTTLFLFLFMGLMSTWIVDALARSDRGLVRRIVGYLELYPLALWLLTVMITSIAVACIVLTQHVTGAPNLALILGYDLLLFGLTVLVFVAVFRRWNPMVRLALFLCVATLTLAAIRWL